MIRGSKPKFSVGIYGEWETGKTTLMKMVEDKINTFVKQEVYLGGHYKK
jgi:nicotinamide riboside kinase